MIFEIIIGVLLMLNLGMVYGISLRLSAIQGDVLKAERASVNAIVVALRVGEQIDAMRADLKKEMGHE